MSIAKVHRVDKSMKPYVCGKCRVELPRGSTYRWYKVGFRTRIRNIRCMKDECTPRNSELDGSKMASVWDAQESFEANLDAATCKSDVASALEEYAQAVREVGEEYREAGTDDNGTEWSPDSIERADTLENAADEIENIDLDDVELKKPCPEECDEGRVDCTNCNAEGTTTGEDGQPVPCEVCDGEGKVDCETCEGEGTVDLDDDDETPDDETMEQLRDAARAALEVELP